MARDVRMVDIMFKDPNNSFSAGGSVDGHVCLDVSQQLKVKSMAPIYFYKCKCDVQFLFKLVWPRRLNSQLPIVKRPDMKACHSWGFRSSNKCIACSLLLQNRQSSACKYMFTWCYAMVLRNGFWCRIGNKYSVTSNVDLNQLSKQTV